MQTLLPAPITSLKKEIDQLFESMWREELPDFPMTGSWMPRMDFSESKDSFLVRAEIPGLDPKDVKVEYHEGMLVLHGEKKRESEEKGERFYRMERSHGTFMRTFRLPAAIDPKRIVATFKNGLLTVTLPKTAESVGNVIPIKVE